VFHVCDSDHSRIYPEFNDHPIYEINVELCNDSYDLVPVFEDTEPVPDSLAGVIDVHSAEIESANEIRADIKQALKIVSPNRLTISPDCGLKLL